MEVVSRVRNMRREKRHYTVYWDFQYGIGKTRYKCRKSCSKYSQDHLDVRAKPYAFEGSRESLLRLGMVVRQYKKKHSSAPPRPASIQWETPRHALARPRPQWIRMIFPCRQCSH